MYSLPLWPNLKERSSVTITGATEQVKEVTSSSQLPSAQTGLTQLMVLQKAGIKEATERRLLNTPSPLLSPFRGKLDTPSTCAVHLLL